MLVNVKNANRKDRFAPSILPPELAFKPAFTVADSPELLPELANRHLLLKIGQWYGVHQPDMLFKKEAKAKAEPTVNFTDVGEVLKASHSVKPTQKPTDKQPQVHLIDKLPQDKEN
ncbi:hypothetical protein V5O48_019564 [Marasmius crinis-equi]|uniref:Uncharacterized protein n=1 Tax=Marasmius crinis-equi TaxID=585013 RepID=A0ABR3EI40_9AGAR